MDLANKYRNSNKPQREDALAYNARIQKEYMARQQADVDAFKARQQKVIDDKHANEQATKLENINQTGQTTRLGMTNDLDRERLGQTKVEQERRFGLADAKQVNDMLNSSRDYKLKQAEADWGKNKFAREEELKKKKLGLESYTSMYRSEAGRADPLGTLQGTAGSRALDGYNNFLNPNKSGSVSPDMGGATFNQEQIDFLNQTMELSQPTGLAQVGKNQAGNLSGITQETRLSKGNNPYNQPTAQGLDRLAPAKSIAVDATNALRPVGNWLTEGVLRRQVGR